MYRRRFLATVGVALPVSGCLDRMRPPDADQPAPDDDDPTATPRDETASEIAIVLHNGTATEQPATVTLASDGATMFEREVTVPSNGQTALETGIDQQGQYELAVAVENGPQETFPFDVEEYDLQAGSNLIVTIDDERVEIVMEE